MKKILLAVTLALIFLTSFNNIKVDATSELNHVVEFTDYSINGYYSFVLDNAADVYEENGNQFIRLTNKGKDYSSFHFDAEHILDRNGFYRIEMDVRYDSNYNSSNLFIGLLNFNLEQPIAWTLATSKSQLDSKVTAIPGSDFVHLSFDFSIEDYYSYFYKKIKIGIKTDNNENIFLDIDNIKVYRGTSLEFGEENIDKAVVGDFENFTVNDTLTLGTEGWTSDHTYYIPSFDRENQIIKTEEGNVLKLYTSIHSSTSITKFVDPAALNNTGWYKIQMKVKAGKKAYIECLGFRLQADKQTGYYADEVLFNTEGVNSNYWVTLEANFYVKNANSPAWVNLDIWYFNRADLTQNRNSENYLLIDDIQIFKAENNIEYKTDLMKNGSITDFRFSQGRTVYPVLSTEDYAYSRELLSKECFDMFETGYKLDVSSHKQKYFGSIKLDIPATVVDIDGYHAMLLTYDNTQLVKTFSSMTYMLHYFDFTINNVYKLSFDYKVNNADTDIIRFAFIGLDNLDDYMIDLYDATPGENYTKGINKDIFTYVVSDNGDCWYHVDLIFKPNTEFKSRVNSFRFLLQNNFNDENKFYFANLELLEYSKTKLEPLVEPYLAQPQTSAKGCEGSVFVSLCGIVVLLGATIVVDKKRRK